MSVLIKGVDMPKSCVDCGDKGFLPKCGLWIGYEDGEKKRHDNCPLVEVSDVPLTYKGEVIGWLNGEAERTIILELTGISIPLGIIESEE